MKIARISKSILSGVRYRGTVSYGSMMLAMALVSLPMQSWAANQPNISVMQPLNSQLKDGKSVRKFGTLVLGKAGVSKVFTIKNDGYARLTKLRVSIGGRDVSDFIVGPIKGSIALKPGASSTFKVQFKPTAVGVRTAKVRVFSNDPNENPFDVTLTGTGAAK